MSHKRIISLVLTLVFLLPTLADVLFVIPLFLSLFSFYLEIWGSNIFLYFLLSGMFVNIPLYTLVLIHNVTATFHLKKWPFVFLNHLYCTYRLPILTSVILSLSTFIAGFLYPYVFPQFLLDSSISPILVTLAIKIFVVILMVVSLKAVPITKLTALLGSLALTLAIGFTGFFLVSILAEFIPQYYFTFSLDDPKGKYLLNYDGDYWLTYYEVQRKCTKATKGASTVENCTEILKKTGNTSITESPEDLAKYLNLPVRIEGEFIRTHGVIMGDEKKFCIGMGYQKKCKISTGPGSWYASPLKIRAIRLEYTHVTQLQS